MSEDSEKQPAQVTIPDTEEARETIEQVFSELTNGGGHVIFTGQGIGYGGAGGTGSSVLPEGMRRAESIDVGKIALAEPEYDNEETVNHPSHYNSSPSGVEAIDVTEHMPHNVASAIEYLWRHDLKGDPIENLEKAIWYAKREIARRKRFTKLFPPRHV